MPVALDAPRIDEGESRSARHFAELDRRVVAADAAPILVCPLHDDLLSEDRSHLRIYRTLKFLKDIGAESGTEVVIHHKRTFFERLRRKPHLVSRLVVG
jgi:hypothetical protein